MYLRCTPALHALIKILYICTTGRRGGRKIVAPFLKNHVLDYWCCNSVYQTGCILSNSVRCCAYQIKRAVQHARYTNPSSKSDRSAHSSSQPSMAATCRVYTCLHFNGFQLGFSKAKMKVDFFWVGLSRRQVKPDKGTPRQDEKKERATYQAKVRNVSCEKIDSAGLTRAAHEPE